MSRRLRVMLFFAIFLAACLTAGVAAALKDLRLAITALCLALTQVALVGVWGVCSVILGVWRLADAPEAAEELKQDLKRAREQLARWLQTASFPNAKKGMLSRAPPLLPSHLQQQQQHLQQQLQQQQQWQ
ncbi:hypothetical protein Efla_002729 [Eimeria flavescens]